MLGGGGGGAPIIKEGPTLREITTTETITLYHIGTLDTLGWRVRWT